MSDNNSNNTSDENIKKIRRNKKTFYQNERDNILEQLKNLMKLDNNNSILLIQLQNNDELKNKLKELNNDIKRFYRCSTWGWFVSINNGEIGDEIVLLKAIFKDHDFTIFSKDITCEYNNIKKRYTKLFFTK